MLRAATESYCFCYLLRMGRIGLIQAPQRDSDDDYRCLSDA